MDIAKEVGRKLKKYRDATGLSQQDIADKLPLTKVAYGNLERGTSLISLEHLVKLPAILGVKLTDLLPDSVVTDYDQARAKDERLDFIVRNWDQMSEVAKEATVFVVSGGIVEKR